MTGDDQQRLLVGLIGACMLHALLFMAPMGNHVPRQPVPLPRSMAFSLVTLPVSAPAPPAPKKTSTETPARAPQVKQKQSVPQPVAIPAAKQRPERRKQAAPAKLGQTPENRPQPKMQRAEQAPPPATDMPVAATAPTVDSGPATAAASAPEMPPAPATKRVEAEPLYLSNPPPPYPALARKRGEQGVARIEVLVDARGRAAEARLVATSGSALLDKAALTAVSSWLFQPGTINGTPVSMYVVVPVRFSLQNQGS